MKDHPAWGGSTTFGRTRCDRSKFLYADYGRTLVHASKDLQPGNAANIFHLRMKKVRMQASVSEWGVSSRAWVLFLYSTRNKNLRGFFMPARWCRIQSILPALSSSQPLCNKSLRTTWQMNKNYNLKAWEHLVSASERNIIKPFRTLCWIKSSLLVLGQHLARTNIVQTLSLLCITWWILAHVTVNTSKSMTWCSFF